MSPSDARLCRVSQIPGLWPQLEGTRQLTGLEGPLGTRRIIELPLDQSVGRGQ